jgi:hypothetical protein
MEHNIITTRPTVRPNASPFNLAAFLTEMCIILVAGIFAASNYADFDPTKRLGGIEAEYLTRTAYTVSTLLPEKGYIPRWDPYMEFGDPTLDNPVSFAYNPFLIVPSILFGPYNGIKLSIILTVIIAGLGGWVLARVLGLGALGRLLLALLCLGKGNMFAFLSQGHWAFFASQAYFPWIFAGILGILCRYRRWPVVLTAVAFALVFFAGSPWFPPAIVVAAGTLTMFYVIERRPGVPLRKFWRAIRIRWTPVGLVILSIALTATLAAVTVFPLGANVDRIGGSLISEDYRADLGVVLAQYVSGVKELVNAANFPEGNSYGFYSFASPLWFVLLVSGLLLVGIVWRKLPALPWRAAGASFTLFVFCTLWGAGQNPIIELAYQVIPLANQFRHVERALAMGSFWLIVLMAIGVDGLWDMLVRNPVWKSVPRPIPLSRRGARLLIAGSLVLSSGLASFRVIEKWHEGWGGFFVRAEDKWENYCITWLRKQYPDRQLAVATLNYWNIYTYYRNEVRHTWVGSDFYHARAQRSNIYLGNLIPTSDGRIELMPEFAIGLPHFDTRWMELNGYKPIPESANPYQENTPCMYRRDGAYSYAYWVTQSDLNTYPDVLPVAVTNPITAFERDYDHIALIAPASTNADVIVTVRELAYPGWQVQIDGKPATVESVGGQIGVILPRDNAQYQVLFLYVPPLLVIGSLVSLATALLLMLYLLHADRFLPPDWPRRFLSQIAGAWGLKEGEH